MDNGHWLDAVERIDCWLYDEALTVPIATRFGPVSRRQGLVLGWETQKGMLYSEAAPFPGLNTETVSHCFETLHASIGRDKQHPILSQLSPATSLAIGSGLMRLNADAEVSTPQPHICGLLSESMPITDALMTKPCVKGQLSGQSVDLNSQRINDLCNRLPATSQIRIDCAGRWNRSELKALLATIPQDRIAYIEDPFPLLSDYADWVNHFEVPFALDDLADRWQSSQDYPGLGALVIKPLAMGFSRALEHITAAASRYLPVVLSSVYESSLQLNFYVWLAQKNHLSSAQGLDTAQYWRRDIIEKPSFENETRPLVQTTDLEYRGRLL